MKRLLFSLVLFTSFICSSAQSNGGDTIPELKLSRDQRNVWDSLERAWTQKHFNPFLKKNKIKVSCSGCERVTFDVLFKINETGKPEPVLLWSKKCESDFTKKQKEDLKKLLSLFSFPPAFYNINIRVFMGRALKC